MGYAITLVTAAVTLGVLVQFLKNPTATNTLFSAGADTINGATHALEGRG